MNKSGEGLLFRRMQIADAEREKMRLYLKKIVLGQNLRKGLLGVRAFAVFCLAFLLTGCGNVNGAESRLLSELEQEAAPENGTKGSEDSAKGTLAGEEAADTGAENAGQAIDETVQTAGSGSVRGGENMEEAGSILVHVCGAVVSPGVYELPEGSRFYEAVEKAGGFAEGACQDYLNMAAPLGDGSRLEIPALQDIQEREKAQGTAPGSVTDNGDKGYIYYTVPEAPAPQAESGGGSSGGLVNINTADIPGLCSLPGIGEGRAKAIVEYREKQGGFQKKEDIMQVSGIGEKMYARMEEYLTVE